jgi:hypothetical protein
MGGVCMEADGIFVKRPELNLLFLTHLETCSPVGILKWRHTDVGIFWPASRPLSQILGGMSIKEQLYDVII